MESLAMKEDFVDIYMSPNRENIYLNKTKVGKDYSCFNWLIDLILEKQLDTPKTIVYCNSLKMWPTVSVF